MKPQTPPKPILLDSSDESIVLLLARSPDDGGAFITDYEIEVDGSLVDANFVKLESYDFSVHGFSYTVLASDLSNPLVAGNYYRFRYRAKNSLGYSEYSDTLRVGLGPLPQKPSVPTRSTDGNTSTSIGVTWNVLASETLEVTAYNLYMDDGQGVSYSVIYSGTCSDYAVEGLTPGVLYSFYVTAVNFNGEGEPSEIVKLKACVAP